MSFVTHRVTKDMGLVLAASDRGRTREEVWSSWRLSHVSPNGIAVPPLVSYPAVSATATACQGRGLDGCVPCPSLSSRHHQHRRRLRQQQVVLGARPVRADLQR